jgi:hypothetical protein
MGVPPDEDIALEGLEREGGARLYLRRFGTFISKWQKLRKPKRPRQSLLEAVACPSESVQFGARNAILAPAYVVDTLSRLVSGPR